MLTRHQVPAATPRSWIALLVTACVSLPITYAQGSGPFVDRASNSIYSALDLSQDIPAHTGITPQLQTAEASK